MAIETPTKVADAATTSVPTKTTDATSTTDTKTADAAPISSTDSGTSSAAEHQLKEAIRLKDEGNALYGKGDVPGAKNRWHHAHLYSSGISTFKHHLSGNNAGAAGAASAAMAGGGGGELGGQPPKSELDKTAEQITLAVMNNLGSCYLAEKNYEKVLYATTKALRVEPNNIKANYRRARAYFELGDLQQAKDCVELAIEKGGGNDGAVKGLAAEINKKAAEKEAKAKSEWKGFLNKKDGAGAGGAGGGGAGGGSPKDVKGKGKAKEENGGGAGGK